MTLGERIKYVRKYNKLNQVDFAKQLGISQTHVSKIEKNVEHPSETLLLFTSYMFAINIDWLKTGDGTPHRQNEGFKGEFDTIRQKLEVMMKYMNDQQSMEFLDSFRNFLSIYSIFFDDKKGFDDERLKAFGTVLRNIFVLSFHLKTTEDIYCEHQIMLLKNSVDNFMEIVLKK